MTAAVQAVLFDLGGVVVEIDWERSLRLWAEYSSLELDELRRRFYGDALYLQQERGEISEPAYFSHLRTVLGFAGDDAVLLQGWNAMLVGEIQASVDVLSRLRSRLPLYLLTNSNPAHETVWRTRFASTIDLFTDVFVSSTLGLRKPDRRTYDTIVERMGVPAPSVLFFDDTLENVTGARAAGLQAVHVTRPSDVGDALQRAGVL